ncbi:MAG: hypothetical protein ACKOCW_02715 [Planctomycetaceae bacterium]
MTRIAPVRAAGILLGLLVVAGCTRMPQVAPPVEPDRARRLLETSLSAWRDGTAITAVTDAGEPVVIQDFDWMQNRKLAAFEVVGEGLVQDANLRVEVMLSFADTSGPKKVAYIVGTAPKPTVFRSFE